MYELGVNQTKFRSSINLNHYSTKLKYKNKPFTLFYKICMNLSLLGPFILFISYRLCDFKVLLQSIRKTSPLYLVYFFDNFKVQRFIPIQHRYSITTGARTPQRRKHQLQYEPSIHQIHSEWIAHAQSWAKQLSVYNSSLSRKTTFYLFLIQF